KSKGGCCKRRSWPARSSSGKSRARGNGMPGEKLACALRSLALGLQLHETQFAAARRDDQAIAGRFDNDAGFAFPIVAAVDVGSQQDVAVAVEHAERVRPGMQAADPIVNLLRGRPPVDDSVFLRQPWRVRRGSIVLRHFFNTAEGHPIENV